MIDQLKQHPMTCAILVLYTGNVLWYMGTKRPGLALYWTCAAGITVCATWLREWKL